MKLFDPIQAEHFCTPLTATPPPGQAQSLQLFHTGLNKVPRMEEGTTNFTVHRVSLLSAVERWLLFGIGHYRRALDMFIPGAAPWIHVTLYYSSFYAANALLGMFGGWVGHETIVEVDQGTPGTQTLRIHRGVKSGPSGYKGSHKVFWDWFYEGCTGLGPWIPPEHQTAIAPVNMDRRWQTNARNAVNYDTFQAHDAALLFQKTFKPDKLGSLSGPLRQQYDIAEHMLKLAIHFANRFKVHSFALDDFGVPGRRQRVVRTVVTRKPPSVVQQSALQQLLA